MPTGDDVVDFLEVLGDLTDIIRFLIVMFAGVGAELPFVNVFGLMKVSMLMVGLEALRLELEDHVLYLSCIGSLGNMDMDL